MALLLEYHTCTRWNVSAPDACLGLLYFPMRLQQAVLGQSELAEGPAEAVPEQVAPPRHPGLPDFPTPSLTPSCIIRLSVCFVRTLPIDPQMDYYQRGA